MSSEGFPYILSKMYTSVRWTPQQQAYASVSRFRCLLSQAFTHKPPPACLFTYYSSMLQCILLHSHTALITRINVLDDFRYWYQHHVYISRTIYTYNETWAWILLVIFAYGPNKGLICVYKYGIFYFIEPMQISLIECIWVYI